jgi:hypothetical protein
LLGLRYLILDNFILTTEKHHKIKNIFCIRIST